MFRSFFSAFIVYFSTLSSICTAQAAIENRVPAELKPISDALTQHWTFLYERAAPEYPDDAKKAFTVKRTQLQTEASLKAIEILRSKGHVKGTGKALVMGGGYEVDLKPLFEEFAEVHVVDMSDAPLKLMLRLYGSNPKLKLFQADLSGIPVAYQAGQLRDLLADVAKTATDVDLRRAYFQKLPETLEPIPFETGEYDLVVSPVLVESLPHGPLVAAFEQDRAAKGAARKGMSDLLGESFFYYPEVMAAFQRVFLHHSKELSRILSKQGVATVSIWARDDNKQAELAPQIEEKLVRVGDDRMPMQEYKKFMKGWSENHLLGGHQIYGPDQPPTMHLYVLEK